MATANRKPLYLDFEKPLVDLQERIERIRRLAEENGVDVSDQIQQLEERSNQLRQEVYGGLSAVQRLQVARHPRRPSTLDYINAMTDDWLELHGDRRGGDDPAIVAARRLQEAEKFEEQFDALVKVREQIARNAGFPNYLAYAFRLNRRFDYTPEDCLKFHAAVDTEFMPVVRQLQAERKRQLGVASVRPWDTAVDPLNRPPLRPFAEVDEMVTRTQRVFDHLDAGLAAGFKTMRDLKLLDLANRKGKAPGGYQSTLAEARLPFIFMNSVGVQRDVETMLHEAGHAFHTLAAKHEDLYAYRSAPIEFCEVASMAMELLGNQHLEEFYPPAEANRARKTHLEGIIGFFPWMASVDAFQHWIYSHPGHSRAERKAAWLALMDRFGGDVDWTGHEAARANLWHRQLHIFLHPFYYVEYGIAQLGALQVWANSHRDPAKALRDYQAGLALGGSRPLPELFAAAGCRFDFSAETVRPLVALTRSELAKLN